MRRTANVPDFPVLDAGWYKLTVLKVELKEDRNGNEYWNIEFQVGEDSKKVWDMFYEMDDRAWKLKKFLREIDEDLINVEVNPEVLVGKKVMAHIIPKKIGDKTWETIREYVKPNRFNPEDLKVEEKEGMPF